MELPEVSSPKSQLLKMIFSPSIDSDSADEKLNQKGAFALNLFESIFATIGLIMSKKSSEMSIEFVFNTIMPLDCPSKFAAGLNCNLQLGVRPVRVN